MLIDGKDNQKMLILERGQKLVSSITEFAIENNSRGGMISAIGALEHVELGYYDLEKKEYLRKTFSETDYELISLHGNISLKDGAPYVHVHAALGGPDFSVFGGHLFEATVAVTAEIFISPFGKMPERKLNPQIGLGLICSFVD